MLVRCNVVGPCAITGADGVEVADGEVVLDDEKTNIDALVPFHVEVDGPADAPAPTPTGGVVSGGAGTAAAEALGGNGGTPPAE